MLHNAEKEFDVALAWLSVDDGGEFFYNETTQMLYVVPNTTHPASTPPPDDLVVPVLQQLIATTGSQKEPVKDINIHGVNFRDTTPVYEEQWEVPSGGDWALHRSAAVFLEGTTNAKVSGGLFKRLDGNAIMLNGFNRGAVIEKNEFVYIADNVLAGWGETKEWDGRYPLFLMITTMLSVCAIVHSLHSALIGVYLICRNGDQPRDTLVQDNIIHEVSVALLHSSATVLDTG